MASFVGDGMDRPGYIAGSKPNAAGERLYDSLSFNYRPAMRMELVALDKNIEIAAASDDAVSAVKAEMLACAFVAGKLISWDLKNAGVHPVPINADNVARMQTTLFVRLYRIIRNQEASDAIPDQEPPKTDAELVGNSEAASG